MPINRSSRSPFELRAGIPPGLKIKLKNQYFINL
jgi:hypothetical protein